MSATIKAEKKYITQWNENLIFLIRSLPLSSGGNPIRFHQCAEKGWIISIPFQPSFQAATVVFFPPSPLYHPFLTLFASFASVSLFLISCWRELKIPIAAVLESKTSNRPKQVQQNLIWRRTWSRWESRWIVLAFGRRIRESERN